MLHESGETADEVTYCGILSCWCHTDVEYHDDHMNVLRQEPDQDILDCWQNGFEILVCAA